MAYAEYRSKLTPYKVHGELNVADGVALNNPQFGQGGLTQRFDLILILIVLMGTGKIR